MNDSNQIIMALSEQVEWYRRLAKLAELQHIYVQNDQTEELLTVLGQRQSVLSEIARLEEIVGPARRQWSSYITTLTGDRKTIAETLMAETRRLLEEITTSDRNDALVLQQRKLNLGKQITQAKAARQVNRNYATAAYGNTNSRLDLSQ